MRIYDHDLIKINGKNCAIQASVGIFYNILGIKI